MPETPATRVYVLDTSVLLADPRAVRCFAEHDVVLPVVVLDELEAKRHPPRARLGCSGGAEVVGVISSGTCWSHFVWNTGLSPTQL